MIIRTAQQGSAIWLTERAGIPTASELDNLVTPEFKCRTGLMPASYLNLKLAEAWTGGPVMTFHGGDLEQGAILEDESIGRFELETGQTVRRVGLITTDDGRVGCSPDGLIGDAVGLECKCPSAPVHIGYLLAGDLPPQYRVQVHSGMWVTGFNSWRFFSYRRGLPPLLLTVERDEAIQEKLTEALTRFLAAFDEGMARLVEINGGPPPKRRPILSQQPKFVSETPT